jgi:hypothetical protein
MPHLFEQKRLRQERVEMATNEKQEGSDTVSTGTTKTRGLHIVDALTMAEEERAE